MKFAIILVLLLIGSCASNKSYNQTTTGKIPLRGGVYKKESWDDVMVLNRMSWYHGMTLYFDALLYKIDPASPFAKWLSPTELEYFTKCESLIVSIAYSSDPSKISHVSFREQMKFNGYDDVVLNNFATYLKTHPSSVEWRLTNYKVLGYCKRAPTRMDTEAIVINFPSFKSSEISL